MNYEASFGILLIFFLWVFIATIWWQRRMKIITSQNLNKKNKDN